MQSQKLPARAPRPRPDGHTFLVIAAVAAVFGGLSLFAGLAILANPTTEDPSLYLWTGATLIGGAIPFWIAGEVLRAIWFLPIDQKEGRI